MKQLLQFDFVVNKENNTIEITREFAADLNLVWSAWTDPQILDMWWAPKPYTAHTKTLEFVEGGHWHYYMKGPKGDIHWCLFDYLSIENLKSYTGLDAFCDENKNISTYNPRVKWHNRFESKDKNTFVNITLYFDSFEHLESLTSMGFKEGFTAGLENLDQYLAAQFYIRKQNKPDNKARVATYLNFPGNTEEVFNFYKKVFRSEFINGISRLGDFPPGPDQAPLAENVKNMILHIELPITGGHVLMGTDAPKEFGFTVTPGNNMHIYLDTESKEEAKRLYDELSIDGVVENPIQDMFWGAYYGNFQDKYGINWMISYQDK